MNVSGTIETSLRAIVGRTACTVEPAEPETSSSRTASCDALVDAPSNRARSTSFLPTCPMHNSRGAHDSREHSWCSA